MTTITACGHCGGQAGQHFTFCSKRPDSPPSSQLAHRPALEKQVDGSHYKDLKIQPLEYIHANGIPFAEGCVIKYVSRWRNKGGIKDLEKAKHFLELLIELESRA